MYPDAPSPEERALLLDKVKQNIPLHRLVESLLSGTHDPLVSVDTLFTTLTISSGRPWRERDAAAWALGRAPLTPEERAAATDMLLEVLERDRQHTFGTTFRKGIAIGYGMCLAFGLLIIVGTILSRNHVHYNLLRLFLKYTFLVSMLASPVILSASTALAWQRSRKRNSLRATAAESLGMLKAPESLGALAGALFDHCAQVREAAATALHTVLPTITEEHYGLLGAASMSALGRALKHGDTRLVLKLLAVLGKIGTSHALPYVEQAAGENRMMHVRDAARDALERIQERHRQEKEAQTLVRASYASPASPAELLRPAHGSAPNDPLQLLRAAKSE